MANPENLKVFPGMSITAKMRVPNISIGASDYYLVPSSAVFDDSSDKPAVWVIDADSLQISKRIRTRCY